MSPICGKRRSIEGRIVAAVVHSEWRSEDGHTTRRMRYVVEYVVNGERRRAEVKQAFSPLRGVVMVDPPVGTRVPLLYHPRTGKVRFDAGSPRINRASAQRRHKRVFERSFRRQLDD